ncbi:MAG: hypothetical protein ACR2KK_13435 [Acidimicrobiales bacterium]
MKRWESARVEKYFDDLGDGEWQRLEADLRSRVALEIGAGAGRFTVLASIGCSVIASDLSNVQLRLNRTHLEEAGLSERVEGGSAL